MDKPIRIPGKGTIDGARIAAVLPLTEERTAGVATRRDFKAEIVYVDATVPLGRGSVWMEETVQDVVKALNAGGMSLQMLPSGEAINPDIQQKPGEFSPPSDPAKEKYHSKVSFTAIIGGQPFPFEQWFRAKPEDLPINKGALDFGALLRTSRNGPPASEGAERPGVQTLAAAAKTAVRKGGPEPGKPT